ENITLPSTLEKIGEYSFGGCYSLTSLELPASLKEIHKDSFLLCKNLTITYKGSTYTYEQLEDFFTAFASVSGHTVVE
ncbi:MAG: leucine-rich repeat domain-containing protein, partial [bacterium]|nr:leucine-rich repeat domain-containing protein [bacterium]